MGNAGRHHTPSYAPRPLPQPMPPADEARIEPGQAIRYSRNFRGGRGVKLEIKNLGPGACEFEGHCLRPGKTAELTVRDGTHDFALEIDSTRGTHVRLTMVAWRAPTYILAKRREIERDPRTHTISSITESEVWVEAP